MWQPRWTRCSGDEGPLQLQARVVAGLEALRAVHEDESVAVVTHAEVIRTLLTHALGVPLDLCLRMDVAPASVSCVHWQAEWVRVEYVNWTRERG